MTEITNHVQKRNGTDKIKSVQGDFSGLQISSRDIRRPNVMVRRIMRTSNSDSDAVTGLDTWRHMIHQFAWFSKTRTVSLLKQIMSHVEWNVKKSKDVFQQFYHWLELISKYVAFSGEKITDTVKITTLALKNFRGNFAQSVNISIREPTTWSQVHPLLVNDFNSAAPVDTNGFYQFTNADKKDEIN